MIIKGESSDDLAHVYELENTCNFKIIEARDGATTYLKRIDKFGY